MSCEERLVRLNRAARLVTLIEAWHQVTESSGVWEALLDEARAELRPSPRTPVSAALIASLNAMTGDIETAEASSPAAREAAAPIAKESRGASLADTASVRR